MSIKKKNPAVSVFRRIFLFYYDGFRGMTVGRTLWIIILVKLFIMFAILKVFFFPNLMNRFDTPQEKADYMLRQLTGTPDSCPQSAYRE